MTKKRHDRRKEQADRLSTYLERNLARQTKQLRARCKKRAEEVADEAISKLGWHIAHGNALPDDKAMHRYFSTTCVNAWNDLTEAEKRKPNMTSVLGGQIPTEEALLSTRLHQMRKRNISMPKDDPSAPAQRNERLRLVKEHRKGLSPKEWQSVRLTLANRHPEEIARKMKTSVAAVRVFLERAAMKLRRKIAS